MSFLSEIRKRARRNPKRIVLPEGGDKRVIKAAQYILRSKMAEVVLLGKGKKIERFDDMVERFFELRRRRGKEISRDEIIRIFSENTVYPAAMMVRSGEADGFVGGVTYKTSDVAKAALSCIDVDKDIKVMSGAFVMEVPRSKYGHKGAFVFSDCGIVPHPSAEQLAGIAVSAAKFAQKVLNAEPRVAVLSYSTRGSAATPDLELIRKAVELARQSCPGIPIDGELQADAALDPDAARMKDSTSGSDVAGRANVLIFPNLDSGNISYKLVQRLAAARAVGPVLLGLDKPASDLSRAGSVDDIIDAVAITSVMAQ